jgi:hypothetical protein
MIDPNLRIEAYRNMRIGYLPMLSLTIRQLSAEPGDVDVPSLTVRSRTQFQHKLRY